MRKVLSITVVFLFLFRVFHAQTSSISGVINSYASVSAIGIQSVTVSSVAGFAAGDNALIIQMKGVSIDTSNTMSYGTITNYNNAGNYEITKISSISANTITFSSPLLRGYSVSGLVQLVKVPSYNNVTITGILTCNPWNGTTGGVLAFLASGTITMNADITVDGNGFLGANMANGAITSCSADTFDYVMLSSSLAGANKGEGIYRPASLKIFGKGAWANGGGSGNDCNGGGAGGGNYGLGGHGGDPKVNVSCPPFFYQNSGGNPAKNLIYSNAANKVFMGGGGGAGHQNDGAGTPGQNGGAIVLISGQNIIGNNHTINSNGIDNLIVAGIDGQGGGGAGGTVLMNVCSYTSLNVSVKGGLGGHDNFTGQDCHGKGGGGAGGIVWSSSPLTNVTTILTGGQPGTFTATACLCVGTSNGATKGQDGGTLTGLILPGLLPPINVVDTNICSSSTTVLDAGIASSYTWSTGNNTQTTTINTSGTYWVQINYPNGCLPLVDTFHVSFVTPPTINYIRDTAICNSTGYTLNESLANALTYTWSTGVTGPSSININNSGIYWVDMNINGCTIRDSAIVTISSIPNVIAPNYTVCNGQTINITPTVNGGTGTYTVNWNTGYSGTNYTTTPTQDSVYMVSAIDANGCASSVQTGSLTLLSPLHVSATGLSICASVDTISIQASASGGNGNYSFTWQPSNTHHNPLKILPNSSVVYTVVVSDGCTTVNATDTAQINITPAPIIKLPNSIMGCSPVCLYLNDIPYDTLKSWQWSFGDNSSITTIQTPFHCYNKSGNFNVSLSYTTNTGCIKTVTTSNLVTVYPNPIANFSASTFNTDLFNTDITLYNQSQGYNLSQWYFGDQSGSSITNPTHQYASVGNYPVTLIVYNQYGCSDTAIHEVIIHDIFTFYTPNSFSPNKDYLNEMFLPIGTGWDNNSFKMLVFDRWGNQVFSSTNVLIGWDGKMKGGDAQEDVYVWKVELSDIFQKKHAYSGTITLLR